MSKSVYYYTDPIAAAWMTKHFGMRFCDRSGVSVSTDLSMWYMADRHYQAGSLIIAPDSLHLLEPQPKDLVYYAYGWGGLGAVMRAEVKEVIERDHERYPKGGLGESHVLLDIGDTFSISRLKRIIQRNGIVFMWPEKESMGCVTGDGV